MNLSAIHRLLVIKLRAVGDVLLSTAVLPNLRAAFPDARLDFLTEHGCRDIVDANPHIDNLLLFKKGGANGATILFEIRRRKYDLVFDLFGNPRSALMTFASGARYRVGYKFRGRSYAYNVLVNPRGAQVHNVEFNLDALRRVGVPIGHTSPLFTLGESEKEFAYETMQRLGLVGTTVVGINPGTNRRTERWPAEKFAEFGKMAAMRFQARILVFWGPGELQLAEAIVSTIGESAVLAPPTTLKQLAAMFTRCAIVVSNDSGPMHIAATVGVPTVGIFGPVNPRLQGPYGKHTAYVTKDGLECLGCNYDSHCPIGNVCMTQLDAETVLKKAESLLQATMIKHA